MPRVVVNSCFGGFGLSHEAIMRYGELAGLNLKHIKDQQSFWMNYYFINGIEDDRHHFSSSDLNRDDPLLVQVVEELGRTADGDYAKLRIADVPDNIKWYIDDYDGIETVREVHRTW